MTLEELIYSRLADNAAVRDMLTEYGGRPALFLQRAPDDTAQEWGAKKYPRAEYLVDMVADPERHSSGVVSVHIYSDDAGSPPEDIAPAVRKALCDIIMQADDGAYCITWERTELFDMEKNMSPNTLVNGCSLTFLLIAFPAQMTKDPDPALAVQDYLKELEPEALVINKDYIENVFEPSLHSPAFYVRVSQYETDRQTYALTWLNCIITIHIIVPTPEARNSWARFLADCLHMAGNVNMPDDSPLLIRKVAVDNAADYLTVGQISVRAQYAVTNYHENTHPLKERYFEE